MAYRLQTLPPSVLLKTVMPLAVSMMVFLAAAEIAKNPAAAQLIPATTKGAVLDCRLDNPRLIIRSTRSTASAAPLPDWSTMAYRLQTLPPSALLKTVMPLAVSIMVFLVAAEITKNPAAAPPPAARLIPAGTEGALSPLVAIQVLATT